MSRRLPVYLRPHEIEQLLEHAPSQRDRLVMLIMGFAGLRVSEVCSLRVEDLDFEDGMIEVRGGKGDKDRTVPMHQRIARELRPYLARRTTGWLFPSERGHTGHICPRAVQAMMESVAQQTSIVRHVTPHKLRHSFATMLLATGADLLEIKDLLGHASVATTQIYVYCQPERLRQAVDRL